MTLTDWTSLAIVLLAIEAFILGVVPLVIFYFAVRGMRIANKKVPRYLKLGQYYSGIVRDQTARLSLKVADPATRAYGEAARADAVWRNLMPRKPKPAASTRESNQ